MFQWIVDTSQRQPRWWGMQCACAFTVFILVYFALYWMEPKFSSARFTWEVILYGFTCFGMYLCAQTDAAFAKLGAWPGNRYLRPLWVVLCVIDGLTIHSGSDAANFASGVALTASLFFATCHPPKPPVRKTQLKAAT